MKKVLLTLVCLLACLPFVNAAIKDVNISSYSANNVVQAGTDLEVMFFDQTASQLYEPTGVLDETAATIIRYDNSEMTVTSTNIEIIEKDLNSFVKNKKALKISFPWIPETGRYMLKIKQGAIMFGSDVNAAVTIPYDNEVSQPYRWIQLEKAGEEPEPVIPTIDVFGVAQAITPYKDNNYFNVPVFTGKYTTIDNLGTQFADVVAVDASKITFASADGSLNITGAKATKDSFVSIGSNSYFANLCELHVEKMISGKYTITFDEGALSIKSGDEVFNNAAFTITNIEVVGEDPMPDGEATAIKMATQKNGGITQDGLNFDCFVYYGTKVNADTQVLKVFPSRISLSDGTNTLAAVSASPKDVTVNGVVYKGFTFKVDQAIEGKYTLTLAEGALGMDYQGKAIYNKEYTIKNISVEAYTQPTAKLDASMFSEQDGLSYKIVVGADVDGDDNPVMMDEITNIDATKFQVEGLLIDSVEEGEMVLGRQTYKCLVINFKSVEAGNFNLTIEEGALEFTVEGKSYINQALTEKITLATIEEPALEAVKLDASMFNEQDGLSYKIVVGVDVDGDDNPVMMDAITNIDASKFSVEGLEIESVEEGEMVFGRQTYKCLVINFKSVTTGNFNLAIEEGAIEFTVEEKTYTNQALTEKIQLVEPKPESTDIMTMSAMFTQNDNIFYVAFMGKAPSGNNKVATVTEVDPSKVSFVGADDASLEIEEVTLSGVPTVVGSLRGIQIVVKEAVAGEYELKLEDDAITFTVTDEDDATYTFVNNAYSYNATVEGPAEEVKGVAITWPADPMTAEYILFDDMNEAFKFVFSASDPASAEDLIQLESVDKTKITLKDVTGKVMPTRNIYKGYSNEPMMVEGNTAIPLIYAFVYDTKVPEGDYTLVMEEGALTFDGGKVNAAFTGTFNYGNATKQWLAPDIDPASGTYEAGTELSIMSEPGTSLMYRFITPEMEAENEEEEGGAEFPWFTHNSNWMTYTLSKTGRLEVYATGEGGKDSNIVVAQYVITPAVPRWDAPTFTPEAWQECEEGTEITITAPEGAFVAYSLEEGSGYYAPAKVGYADEVNGFILTDQNSVTFTMGTETMNFIAYSYGEGKKDSDKEFASFYAPLPPVETLAEPIFEPESGYEFKISEGGNGKVTITAPEGALVSYMIMPDDDPYSGEFVDSETNVVEVEISSDCTIRAYSKDPDPMKWDTYSAMVDAVYTVEVVGINGIYAEFGNDVEIFTMNGVRVTNSENLEKGIYLVVKAGKTTKVLVK